MVGLRQPRRERLILESFRISPGLSADRLQYCDAFQKRLRGNRHRGSSAAGWSRRAVVWPRPTQGRGLRTSSSRVDADRRERVCLRSLRVDHDHQRQSRGRRVEWSAHERGRWPSVAVHQLYRSSKRRDEQPESHRRLAVFGALHLAGDAHSCMSPPGSLCFVKKARLNRARVTERCRSQHDLILIPGRRTATCQSPTEPDKSTTWQCFIARRVPWTHRWCSCCTASRHPATCSASSSRNLPTATD